MTSNKRLVDLRSQCFAAAVVALMILASSSATTRLDLLVLVL